jgi:2-phosphoglycolate phosphatase
MNVDRMIAGKATDLKCVMFDLDGTLVDSIPGYFRLMEEILKTVGLPPVPKELVAEFMTDGLGVLEKMIPPELSHRKETLVQECIAVGRSISWSMFRDRVQVFEGVSALFELLRRKGILMAVVTSTEKAFIDKKMIPLERQGLLDALSAVIAIEDAPLRKPAPDPLLVCARRLGIAPAHAIYIGDSHVDIRAGKAAGMLTIGVLSGLDDRETLAKENPTLIMNSVADVLTCFESIWD